MPIIIPGGGGGGFKPARNVGQVQLAFSLAVPRGTTASFSFTLSDGDASMVNLTTPAAPKIVTAGIYAFMLDANQTVGGDQPYAVGLIVDDAFYSVRPVMASLSPLGWADRSLAVTWWCEAQDPFSAYAQVDNTGASDPTFAGNLYIQRIS